VTAKPRVQPLDLVTIFGNAWGFDNIVYSLRYDKITNTKNALFCSICIQSSAHVLHVLALLPCLQGADTKITLKQE
jgi:hypothetical protein